MSPRPALLALLLAGCTTVGPDYAPPAVAVPDRFSEAPGGASEADLTAWWRRFDDPQLTALVERALADNLDVAAASARIREARALERAAGASTSPRIAAEASVTRQRISENAIPVPPGSGGNGGSGFGLPGTEFTSWRAGFDAAWELDLFGRNRREMEAASARTAAALWDRRDVELMIAAEVARTYLALRTSRQKYNNAEAEYARVMRVERLVAARASGGLITGEEGRRLEAERSAAFAALAPIRAEIEIHRHALGVLVGAGPDAIARGLHLPPAAPVEAIDIPPGLPSELLRRRPDIRAAERELAAATADIGVAVADLYPRISLTAAPALVSTALTSLLEWGSRSFTAGAALDWPIFDGGRRRAMVEVRSARQEQALIAYRRVVLSALQDVEDSLSRIAGNREQLRQLANAVNAAAAEERLAMSRFDGGLVDYSAVLQAQERRLSLEERVIETRGALARDMVALAKALGGGWNEEPSS